MASPSALWSTTRLQCSGKLTAATLGSCPCPSLGFGATEPLDNSHREFPNEITLGIFLFVKYLNFLNTLCSMILKFPLREKTQLKVCVRTWTWVALMGEVSGGVITSEILLHWSCTSQDSVFGYPTPNTEKALETTVFQKSIQQVRVKLDDSTAIHLCA